MPTRSSTGATCNNRRTDTLELPVIVIGGGGHAKVLVSTLLLCHRSILGFVDLNPTAPPLLGIRRLGSDGAVRLHAPDDVKLVNGVGSTGSTAIRQNVYDRFTRERYCFATVIHPSAVVAPEVQIEDGVQVLAGAVVQTGCRLGANVIVNTGARIDHDCIIDSHVHVAPGVTLCGAVHVCTGAHIGAGATVIQGIRIGAGSVVGAGALVIRDVPQGATVVGVPAASMPDTGTAR
jgi:sugar O-acyltransferase (sialic acid O-acetyltransferase NeuD family)